MTGRSAGRRPDDRQGFSLLEVLAAVAILGLWYVVLATISIQGLRAEGESNRRLRASLLADEVLADLEIQLNRGLVPPSEESERGDYHVQIDVEELPLSELLPVDEGAPDDPRSQTPPSASSSLFAGAGGQGSPLSRIQVQVFWSEGFDERSVSRTTFGLDRQAILPMLEGLQAAEGLQ